jgi:hypothetical protein
VTLAGARFAWRLNLDAELELAALRYQPEQRVLAQLARHGALARQLLGEHDVLIEPGARAPAGDWIGRAWCPTPRALAELTAAGVTPEPHPAASVLLRVNHRRFACELGGGLPGQRYCEGAAALDAALDQLPRPCLLKRPLAFAGRGQLRVLESLDGPQRAWIAASLRRDGLVVEPLVLPTLELSLHGFVWQDGRHELGRICRQEVSARGVFKGARRAQAGELTGDEERALFDAAERSARALAGAGYFGPFGVDAYRYEGAHGSGFCALSEINARYTMSFVSGFPRPPGELRLEPAGGAERA